MKTIKTIATGLALSAALFTAATQGLAHTAKQDQQHHKAKAHQDQHVTVIVDEKGYHPATFSVKAGREVHLTFVSKGGGCANDISIPALKKTFKLKPGQKREVVFTPKKGQTIAFACTMKMFKGKVTAK